MKPKIHNPKVLAEEAEQIGYGVQSVPTPRATLVAAPMVSLDPPPTWVDTPCVEGQLGQEGQFRYDKRFAKVFDLSKATQMQEYNDLLSLTSDPSTNTIILSQEQKFSEDTANWKVLVICQTVKFKQIIKDPKK